MTQRRYALLVRVTHWINAVALILQLHRSLGWLRGQFCLSETFPGIEACPEFILLTDSPKSRVH